MVVDFYSGKDIGTTVRVGVCLGLNSNREGAWNFVSVLASAVKLICPDRV